MTQPPGIVLTVGERSFVCWEEEEEEAEEALETSLCLRGSHDVVHVHSQCDVHSQSWRVTGWCHWVRNSE